MSQVMANPVLEAIRERHLQFAQEEDELRELLDFHTSISNLSHSPGWERLVSIVEDSIRGNTNKLVQEVDPRNIAFLQAQVQSLRWLIQIPEMSRAQVEAARQREADLKTRKEEYVETGL